MKYDNVVPFDPFRRDAAARRGTADKMPPKTVVLNCPTCASALCLETRWLDGETDLLCGRCETEIPLAPARESAR